MLHLFRSQSYDRECCKNLQRHEETSAFWKQIYFILIWRNGLVYYNAGVVHSCKYWSRRIGPGFIKNMAEKLRKIPSSMSPVKTQIFLGRRGRCSWPGSPRSWSRSRKRRKDLPGCRRTFRWCPERCKSRHRFFKQFANLKVISFNLPLGVKDLFLK
jgi:hypothetical protein